MRKLQLRDSKCTVIRWQKHGFTPRQLILKSLTPVMLVHLSIGTATLWFLESSIPFLGMSPVCALIRFRLLDLCWSQTQEPQAHLNHDGFCFVCMVIMSPLRPTLTPPLFLCSPWAENHPLFFPMFTLTELLPLTRLTVL